MQAKIDGFVIRNSYTMTTDQMIATIMLEFGLYFDDASRMVLVAIKNIKGIK